jgi:hypothetical protein
MSHLRAARPDRRRALIVLAILIASMCCSAPAMAADLTATPSTFASVFSSAKAGDRILLASGDYGDWAGGSKSGTVTIMPEAGASPVMGINFNNAANIRVDGLTLTWMSIDGASHDLAFANSKFTGAATIRAYSLNNSNIVLDHNTHANINVCGTCYEGRVEVIGNGSGPSGVTIKNSTFGPGGDADGIQIGAIGVKVLNNEFTGIKQVSAVHTDSLQLMGTSQTVVDGNYFHDFSTAIMAPDGGNRDTFTNNVFDGDGSYRPAIQLGSTHDSVFAHNTTRNLDVYMDRKNESTDNSANGVLRDNVIVNGTINTPSAKCTNCTVSYNLFSAAGNASGTNTVVGTPAFAGGANPNSWAGFALASGSPGKANAGDGTDRGIDASGTTPPPPPPPPPADTTAPDTSITSGPTGTTNDGTPTFAFTATETGSTFECRVDNDTLSACNSPYTTFTLSDGSHTFEVLAIDAAGNADASPASRSFSVDTVPPETTVVGGPPDTTYDTTATFGFESSEGGAIFSCRIDMAALSQCRSPYTTSPLAIGSHTFDVRATDGAGNTDSTPASRSWMIVADYRRDILATSGLVSYWRLDEKNGITAGDAIGANSGRYRNGVLLDRPSALLYDSSTSAGFDGSNDYVSVPDSASLDTRDSFTLEAWIRRSATSSSTQTVLSKGNAGARLSFVNNVLTLAKNNAATIARANVSTTDTTAFHHVVATKSGAIVRLYIDGVDRTGVVTNRTVANTATAVNIGRDTAASAYFAGLIDEVAVYNVPLTATEVQRHFKASGR